MTSPLSPEEFVRYSRHLLIPEIGLEGQLKLIKASILVIGTGGLGSPVSLYLAAAGVGHIGLVDYDVVDLSNLQRQVIHGTSGIGTPKVESAQKRLLDLNPNIQVDAFDVPFTSANAISIIGDYDLVIDCSDNFPARYLSNDACVLTGKPYVYGSIYRFDGQVSVFDAKHGPCYRCLLPEPPPPGSVPGCAETGVLGVLPGTIGTIQATEALKIILGLGSTLIGKLLLYNAIDLCFNFVNLRKNPKCKVCGVDPEIKSLIDYDAFCGFPGHDQVIEQTAEDMEISVIELNQRLRSGQKLNLIDVREPHEQQISQIDGASLVPLGRLTDMLSELDRSEELVVFCRTGVRSRRAQELLLDAGFHRVKNLSGGINAWVTDIDPDQPVY